MVLAPSSDMVYDCACGSPRQQKRCYGVEREAWPESIARVTITFEFLKMLVTAKVFPIRE